MKRRSLLAGGAATLLAAPMSAGAQRKKEARICMLNRVPRQDPFVRSMFARLSDLGWSEGLFGSGNLKVEYREVASDAADVAPLVDAVLRFPCDLVVTTTTPSALAVKSVAPPIAHVFYVGGDPVALGLVATMARPGGHSTGWTLASHESGIKLLGLLRDVAPQAKRCAVIFTGGNASSQQTFTALATKSGAIGVTLKAFPVHSKQEIHALDAAWVRESVDGLIVPFEPLTVANAGDIVRLAALHRIPAAYGSRFFVDAGGLLSYGVNWGVEVKRTADFIARILDGAKPADIPVETAQNFELLVNLGAARALGISVPQSVLAQATEVIQ